MQVLGGYVLESKLGEGGMGAVFRATHPRFPGQTFAIKLLATETAPKRDVLERFKREMHALAAVTEHPNVVKCFGGHVEGERPFIVMELVKGSSLQALAKDKGLAPEAAAKLVREVADAIEHVHGQGVIHRDLKPANVLVQDGLVPRVCDFGLARLADAEQLTRTGSVLGTPAFSAPEQLDGRAHKADERADVYSLGAILYFCLAGKPPFEGVGGAVTRRVLLEPAKPPSRSAGGIAPELDAICLKALEKDPEHRYATAAAFRNDLDRFLAGEPVLARPPTRLAKLRRFVRRRRRSIALAGAGLLVAAAAPAVLVARWRVTSAEDRLVQTHVEAALRPGATAAEIALELEAIPSGRSERALVERRQDEVRYETDSKDAKAGNASPAQLVRFAEAAVRLDRANLIGEEAGFVHGEALLVPADVLFDAGKDASELLGAAAEMAEKCRTKKPLAARVLRAYTELAHAGLPRRALGPGRIVPALGGGPKPDELDIRAAVAGVRADLEAGRGLPGPLGARAAWLLADLLAVAGDREGAAAAVEAAKKIAPDEPARAVLEAALSEKRELEAVFLDLAPRASKEPGVAFRLSRWLALSGRSVLLERPELAAAASAATIEGIAARDRPEAFAFDPTPRPERYVPEIGELYRRLRPPDSDAMNMFQSRVTEDDLHEEMLRRRAGGRDALEKALAENLEVEPREQVLLDMAGSSYRRGLCGPVFMAVIADTDTYMPYALAFAFCENRETSRLPTGSSQYFFREEWDPPGLEGEKVCRWFDAQLSKDLASDPVFAVVVRRTPKECEAARLACTALRKLEEVDGGALDEPVRDRLAFEALRDLEPWAELAPAAALPFRARAHRAAFPGALGEALAALDLQRALRAPDRIPLGDEDAGRYALLCGSVAGYAQGPVPGTKLVQTFYAKGAAKVREAYLIKSLDQEGPKRLERYERLLQDWKHVYFEGHRSLKGLARFFGAEEFVRRYKKDFTPSPSDLDVLGSKIGPQAYIEKLKRAR